MFNHSIAPFRTCQIFFLLDFVRRQWKLITTPDTLWPIWCKVCSHNCPITTIYKLLPENNDKPLCHNEWISTRADAARNASWSPKIRHQIKYITVNFSLRKHSLPVWRGTLTSIDLKKQNKQTKKGIIHFTNLLLPTKKCCLFAANLLYTHQAWSKIGVKNSTNYLVDSWIAWLTVYTTRSLCYPMQAAHKVFNQSVAPLETLYIFWDFAWWRYRFPTDSLVLNTANPRHNTTHYDGPIATFFANMVKTILPSLALYASLQPTIWLVVSKLDTQAITIIAAFFPPANKCCLCVRTCVRTLSHNLITGSQNHLMLLVKRGKDKKGSMKSNCFLCIPFIVLLHCQLLVCVNS